MKPYVIWKMFHKEILEQTGSGSAFFRVSGGTNSQNFSARSQLWWRLHRFHVRTGLLKKTGYVTQAFIQALLSTVVFSQRLSFFTVCTKMHLQHTFCL